MRTTEHQTRTAQARFETREDDGGAPRIEGYFAVFGQVYDICPGGSESVDPHAFDGAIDGQDIRCLVDHETRLVLGRTAAGTLTLKADEHGLWGSVAINTDDSDAMNLLARVRRGDVSQCSFGFDILDEETEYREDGSIHWTIKAVRLYEVSVVTFPAYTDTQVQARSEDIKAIRRRQAQALRARLLKRLGKDAENGT